MNFYTKIEQIDLSSQEGKLLYSAIALINTQGRYEKMTPDEILTELQISVKMCFDLDN